MFALTPYAPRGGLPNATAQTRGSEHYFLYNPNRSNPSANLDGLSILLQFDSMPRRNKKKNKP